MLLQETLHDQLQQHDFDQLARKESNGRRRIRLLALAHLKEGRNCSEVADALRVTRPCGHALATVVWPWRP